MAFDSFTVRGRAWALAGILLISLIGSVGQAEGAGLWVTSTADSGPGSLRQAIAEVTPGDTIFLAPELSFRTITLASPLDVDKNLTIEGRGAPGVAISGNDLVRIFDIGNSGAACGINVMLRAIRVVHANELNGASGGGVLTCANTLTVELVSFEDNQANAGGGLHQTGGTVTIRDSAFTGNEATTGGALKTQAGTLVLERVSVTGNEGATIVHFEGSTVTATNITIYENTASLGSTMFVGAGAVVTMRNATIGANINWTGVGPNPTIHNNGGSLEFENSIISNTKNCSVVSAPVDLGGNLEFGAESCGFTSADPQLGTLGFYGSTIVQTVPIAAASPARDAGDNAPCPAKDGRSKQRAVGVGNNCDSGAFEYDGPLTATVTNLNDAGAGSLRQALADIGSGGTIDFQAGLTGDITIDTPLVAHRAMTIAGPGHTTLAIARNSSAGNFRLLETGSGPFCQDMAIAINGLTFRDGDANGANGGAISNCANLSVEDARFANNLGLLGSAIFTEGQSRLKLERVRLEETSPGSLGALYAGANVYHVVIQDSSFDGAGANVQFDAVHAGLLRNVTVNSPGVTAVVTQGARTALEHVTLSGDAGFVSAGGSPNNPVSIANSIVIGVSLSSCISSGPHYESRGGNVFQGACAALAADASNIAANPLLGALALHAPGVVKTHSLTPGSAAINHGNPAYCPAADARGVTRPQGAACDAGAFEAHTIVVTTDSVLQGLVGAPLTLHFTQTGAIGAATFTMPPDQVPPGLTLAPDGVLSGAVLASGIFHFTLTATDATGVGGAASFTLTVDGPPTVTLLLDREVTRNGVLAPLTFTVGDAVTAAGALTVTAASNNQALVPDANVVIGGSGAARTVTVTPLPGAFGQAVITITVSDGQFTTFMAFNVTVMPVYYLAEGATGPFFDLDLLIANPNSTNAHADIVFLLNDGTTVEYPKTIAPMSRVTIAVDEIPGLESAAVSSVVTSTSGLPLIVERTMRWDATGYGSHTEAATQGAAPEWYFAEGAQGFFGTFILLANPNAETTTAHVTYFREGAAPVTRDYPLLPLSRVTIDAGADPELVGYAFGARVTFDRPGIAERAMYFSVLNSGQLSGGHASAGVTSPATSWFLAEGATGSYFNTFLLLVNPQGTATTATLTYLPFSGTPVTRTVDVPALGRATINIALEDASLADTAVATRVESTLPIVVERSQYWPVPVWHEAHNSFGVTAAATRWGLAEGRVGGANAWQTYILLANPGTDAAEATITFLREDGTPLVKTFSVPPTSRVNVAVTGADSMVPELADESFGAIIDATLPIVVERSLYNNANGVVWAAGSNAGATRLP
jgi:hypothetical protein